MNPEILCREAYHRGSAVECEFAREMLWGNGAVAIQMINNYDVDGEYRRNR
jgi:hypothetical protein